MVRSRAIAIEASFAIKINPLIQAMTQTRPLVAKPGGPTTVALVGVLEIPCRDVPERGAQIACHFIVNESEQTAPCWRGGMTLKSSCEDGANTSRALSADQRLTDDLAQPFCVIE
jgi:hypothetical protein